MLLWIATGIATLAFGILTVLMEKRLTYNLRKIFKIPGGEPAKRPLILWYFYWMTAFVAVVGAAMASSAPSLEFTRMNGDFRIAVAGFAKIGHDGDSDLGEELAKGVQLRLEENLKELNPDFIISIWGPNEVGTIDEPIRDQRADEAELLAEKIDADMIIYGLIDTSQPIWQVTPEFYLSNENFFEANEITGQHDIGSPFPLFGKDNIAGRVIIGEEFSIRVQALAKIAVGLAYYAIHRYDTALDYFLSIEKLKNLTDDKGKQVVYLLIGNAAGKSGQIDLSNGYYQKALAIDPEYARAYVGLGSVAYIRALETFNRTKKPQDTDIQYLNIAIQRYQRALAAQNKPALADIDTKVHFGLGQSHFMLVYSGNEEWFDPAIVDFNLVVEAYGDGKNPRLRELAAEAHARLGLIYDLSGNPDKAIEEYQSAASLLFDYPDRQTQYLDRIESLGKVDVTP